MNLTPNRDIEALSEPFRTRLKAFLSAMKQNDPMWIYDGLRSQLLQEYYVNIGASKTLRSNHLTGNAADLYFAKPPHFPPSGDIRWRKAAEMAKKFGINNGGIMWNWDWNHFELSNELALLDESFVNNKVIWRLANDAIMDIEYGETAFLKEKLAKIKEFVHTNNEVLRINGIEDNIGYQELSNQIFLKTLQNGNNPSLISKKAAR